MPPKLLALLQLLCHILRHVPCGVLDIPAYLRDKHDLTRTTGCPSPGLPQKCNGNVHVYEHMKVKLAVFLELFRPEIVNASKAPHPAPVLPRLCQPGTEPGQVLPRFFVVGLRSERQCDSADPAAPVTDYL